MSSKRSRVRVRPTRDETKAKLLDAAAMLFADQGIGATSIEDICTKAGFSRGAFYSSFSTKDDIVFELLDLHFEMNQIEAERLYSATSDTVEYIEAMSSPDRRRRTLPVDDIGMLYIELTLYAVRDNKNRERLVERQRRDFAMMRDIVQRIMADEEQELPADIDDVVHLLLGLDMGLLIHALVDPETQDPNRWARIVTTLHRLLTAAP